MRASFVDYFPLETFFFGGKSIGLCFFFFFIMAPFLIMTYGFELKFESRVDKGVLR